MEQPRFSTNEEDAKFDDLLETIEKIPKGEEVPQDLKDRYEGFFNVNK